MATDHPLVLIVGSLMRHAVEQIEAEFATRQIPAGDVGLLQNDEREAVRAVAPHMIPITAELMDALPNLEIVASFGVGYDSVDAAYAGRSGIMVTNTPDVLTEEVADTAIALLLNTVRGFNRAEQYLRNGRWEREGSFPLSAGTLRGRTVGIFGMGRIGQAVARRLEGFDVSIAYHNRRPVEGAGYAYYPSLLDLAQAVDTLINVAPATAETRGAVNADVLAALGPSGVLINIGRGSTVDENALIDALQRGTIFAAGLDVFANEPSVPEALLQAPNAVLLPHVGSASQHTRQAMADLQVANLRSWFEGGKALTPVPETVHVTRTGS